MTAARGHFLPLVLALAAALGAASTVGGCSSAVRWESPQPAPRGQTKTSRPPSGARPEVHVVRSGETLYSIAFRYGLRTADIAAWNQLGDGTLIRVGQRLRLHPPGSRQGSSPKSTADNAAGRQPPPGRPPPTAIEAAPRWQWPVRGAVVGNFGDSPMTASGIQIGGMPGSLVNAAAAGQVVYAGSGLAGYGQLLIIKHSENWLSAYGFNEALLVREGDRVSQGQQIARMGEAAVAGSRERRPLLHFEIRRNGDPVNPLGLLPSR